MPDWQRRVIEERDELSHRVGRLREFMAGAAFASLDPKEQERLTRQYLHMSGYHEVLVERISAF